MNTQSDGDPRTNDLESGEVRFSSGESTPLLSVSPSATSLEIAKHDTTEPYVQVARQEVNWICSSSTLVIFTFVLQSSIFTTNLISVSHLGAHSLAAMSLATTCAGIIALAPVFGLLSAMDTFCSTAFTASRDKTLVGFHLQRGLIAVITHLIIVAPILWNAEKILLAIGQDPEIARLAGLFLRIHILSILPSSTFEACKRYLQSQGIMHAGTIIVIIVAPIHWVSSYVFVRSSYGLGFIGAPIANALSYWLLMIGILIYIRFSRASETWGGWDYNAFKNMSAYYRLAIPAVITVCAEWVGFELLTLGVSYFGANQLAANAIVLNSVSLIFQFNNGLGYGTSPRVGNLIGAAKPRQARIASEMAIMASIFIGGMGTLFLAFFGKWWSSIYTNDPNVIDITTSLIPVTCVFLVSDGLNAVMGAVLRGLGHQEISANAFLAGFYLCAVPISLYLGYGIHMQVVGMWWGLCIGVIVTCILQLVYVFKYINWNNEVRRCSERLCYSDQQQSTNESTNSLTE